jgi:hypothetical protein
LRRINVRSPNKPNIAGSAWQARRSPVLGRRTEAGRLYSEVTAAAARLSGIALEIRGFEEDSSLQETGVHNGAFGADKFGLRKLKGVNWNFGAPQLYEHALAAGEAV